MIRLTITGVEETIADVDRRLALMHEGVEQDLDWFGRTTSEEMIETHTFQNRTFRLEGSIGYDVHPFDSADEAAVEVFAHAEYASQVEFGHPGPPAARPYPFFYPVWFKWEPILMERLQGTVEQALYNGQIV